MNLVDFLAMAKPRRPVAITNWALSGNAQNHIVGDLLISMRKQAPPQFLTPGAAHPSDNGFRRTNSFWTTGTALVAAFGGTADHPDRVGMVEAMSAIASYFGGLSLRWDGTRLIVKGAGLIGSVCRRFLREQKLSHGDCCLEWLPYAHVISLRLYTGQGTTIGTSDLTRLCARGMRLRDIMHWHQHGQGNVTFTALCSRRNCTTAYKAQFVNLVRALVVNFPQLLQRPRVRAEIRFLATPRDHPVTASLLGSPPEVTISAGIDRVVQCSTVCTQPELTGTLARTLLPNVRVQYVHPHPLLCRMVCLWVGHRRWSQSRQHYKRQIAATSRRNGLANATDKTIRWRAASSKAADGLGALEWNRIRRVVGLAPWGEQILLRLKNYAFSLYDRLTDRLGCPHAECSRVRRIDLYHVFWTCPAATTLRHVLTQRWRALGMVMSDLEVAVFSLRLPNVPPMVWEIAEDVFPLLSLQEQDDLTEAVVKIAESCWRIGAALYFHAVWRWRVAHFDPLNNVSEQHIKSLFNARLTHGYSTVHLHLTTHGKLQAITRAATVMRRALAQTWVDTNFAERGATTRYLLFFDGGSRGNPGPGGSGAVVMKVGSSLAEMQVCWALSFSYAAKTTTNNLAENQGLLHGLKACLAQRFTPLHVVGDSAMIIRQHATGTPPQASHLKSIYWQCRRLAGKLKTLSWQHHLRDHNKTADALANIAMDTKRSAQRAPTELTTQDDRWRAALAHASRDVGHWLARNSNEDLSGFEASTV